jgi:hypothetical protein
MPSVEVILEIFKLGNSIDINLVQPLKADSIAVRKGVYKLDKSIDFKALQPKNI